jgi:hypothetical protein
MAGSAHRYFAGLSQNTFLLAAASLFADISTEMLYPVLPVFLTQTLKANGSIVGLVDGFAQAAQNIVQGFSGALSDKLQRRKPVAIFGYRASSLCRSCRYPHDLLSGGHPRPARTLDGPSCRRTACAFLRKIENRH